MNNTVRLVGIVGALLASSACKRDPVERDSSANSAPSASNDTKQPPMPEPFTRFRVEGAEQNVVPGASANLMRSKDGTTQIELSVPSDYRQRTGVAYIAMLFFGNGFAAKPGKYEIVSDYRGRADAAGALLMVQRNTLKTFAHRPKGEVTLALAGDKLVGYFNFTVVDTDAIGVSPKTTNVVGQFEWPAKP